jgi:hypothetical protein
LFIKQVLSFCAEKGEEIIVIGFENEKKQGNAQGKTQSQEGRRNEGNFKSTSENELKDEKKYHG